MLIGYLPASPQDVGGASSRQALVEAGCKQIVEEKPAAVSDRTQPELQGLLQRLQKGDTLVVPHLRRLGGSLAELVECVQSLTAGGVSLRSLGIAQDRSAFPLVGQVSPINDQVAHNSATARLRGAGGRPPKLSQEARTEVIEAVLSGRSKAASLARRFKVSEATISRVLAARRADGSRGVPGGSSSKQAIASDRVVGVLSPIALDTRLAVVGTSGSGKTYAAKGLLERVMAGGGRACVVDPLGVW